MSTFKKAFDEARSSGKRYFKYKGKLYTTKSTEDVSSSTKLTSDDAWLDTLRKNYYSSKIPNFNESYIDSRVQDLMELEDVDERVARRLAEEEYGKQKMLRTSSGRRTEDQEEALKDKFRNQVMSERGIGREDWHKYIEKLWDRSGDWRDRTKANTELARILKEDNRSLDYSNFEKALEDIRRKKSLNSKHTTGEALDISKQDRTSVDPNKLEGILKSDHYHHESSEDPTSLDDSISRFKETELEWEEPVDSWTEEYKWLTPNITNKVPEFNEGGIVDDKKRLEELLRKASSQYKDLPEEGVPSFDPRSKSEIMRELVDEGFMKKADPDRAARYRGMDTLKAGARGADPEGIGRKYMEKSRLQGSQVLPDFINPEELVPPTSSVDKPSRMASAADLMDMGADPRDMKIPNAKHSGDVAKGVEKFPSSSDLELPEEAPNSKRRSMMPSARDFDDVRMYDKELGKLKTYEPERRDLNSRPFSKVQEEVMPSSKGVSTMDEMMPSRKGFGEAAERVKRPRGVQDLLDNVERIRPRGVDVSKSGFSKPLGALKKVAGRGAKALPFVGPAIGIGSALLSGDAQAALGETLGSDALGKDSDIVPRKEEEWVSDYSSKTPQLSAEEEEAAKQFLRKGYADGGIVPEYDVYSKYQELKNQLEQEPEKKEFEGPSFGAALTDSLQTLSNIVNRDVQDREDRFNPNASLKEKKEFGKKQAAEAVNKHRGDSRKVQLFNMYKSMADSQKANEYRAAKDKAAEEKAKSDQDYKSSQAEALSKYRDSQLGLQKAKFEHEKGKIPKDSLELFKQKEDYKEKLRQARGDSDIGGKKLGFEERERKKASIKDEFKQKEEAREESRESKKAEKKKIEDSKKFQRETDNVLDNIDKAIKLTRQAAKSGMRTGPIAGRLPSITKEAQELEQAYSKISFDNFIEKARGMSRAFDSDQEREFYERTQPNMKMDEDINLKRLMEIRERLIRSRNDVLSPQEDQEVDAPPAGDVSKSRLDYLRSKHKK